MRQNKWIGLLMAGAVLVSSMAVPVSAGAEQKKVDLNGVYHAALGVSTSTQIWINRNAYYDQKENKTFGTDQFAKLVSEDSATGEQSVHEGTFTDVEIKGNGTYTVKLEDANFEGETTVCMLHVPTDIPVCEEIKFSDVSAKVNGRTILSFDEAYMEDETPYLTGGMDVILMNHWREELVKQLDEKGMSESSANGWDILTGAGNESIEVTFTVSGFNYDKEVEETPEPTKAAAEGKDSEDKTGRAGTVAIVLISVVIAGSVLGLFIVRRKNRKEL